jgi:O-antigen/teichoic acid export membrane protein
MIVEKARKWGHHFLSDNLFRNSVYLMLTTGLMGGLGFFFWLIAAHIFSPDEIGVGTALISAMSLISTIGLLGFNTTLIRVLPNSQNRNNEINTGSILVIGASAIISMIYLFLVPRIAPNLVIIDKNIWYAIGFVIMVSLASINSLTDSIFIAYRAAQYTLITDGIVTSGTKLFLPLVFVGLGAYGVFAAAGLAASIGMIASVLYLIIKFGYKPKLEIDWSTLKGVFTYSFANYIANLLAMAPTLVLPIIVVNRLGGAAAAYYYLAFMIINLIYAIATSVSQSLFVEGSYSEGALRGLLKRAMIVLVSIMIPACIILALAGHFILNFFGKSYGAGGADVIILLASTAPIIAAYNIGNVLLRITRQNYAMVSVNIIYAVVIIVLALLWVDRGLTWVAMAWIAGNTFAAIAAFLAVFHRHYRHLRTRRLSLQQLGPR